MKNNKKNIGKSSAAVVIGTLTHCIRETPKGVIDKQWSGSLLFANASAIFL